MELVTVAKTFADHLLDDGGTEFILHKTIQGDGSVQFYVHPFGRNGETLDFEAVGNQLTCITKRVKK